MSGAEAGLVLGLVSSALTVLEAAYQVYSAAHDAKGLTKDLRAVAEQIPLVLHTLGLIQSSVREERLSAEAVEAVKPMLERCEQNADLLKQTFDKVLPSKDAPRMERYKKAVQAKAKSEEMRAIMGSIMQDLALLQQHQAFQDAEIMEDIKIAIEELNRSQGDDRDSHFTHLGSGHVYGHTGSGSQENHTYTNSGSGDFYASKSMTIHKGKVME